MSDSGDLSVESLSEEENQKEYGNDEMVKGESERGSRTFALSERKAKNGHWITDAWIYDDRQYYATSGYKISEKAKREQPFIFSFQDIFETLDSSTEDRQADTMAKGGTDWMCSDEESIQLARDCFRARDNNNNNNNNHSSEDTTAPFNEDHTSLSRNPYDRNPFNKTSSRRKLQPSKSRKLSNPKSPSASETTSSDTTMTSSSSADDRRWIVAEMAPQRASAVGNVSAIGYKSATIGAMSEELATVGAAVASVLVFWSLLGAVVCLVLRLRRRKRRRRFKRHSVVDDDVAHIDMLDEMIRTELARGRARMNNATQCPPATPSSPTYVNVPPPPQFHYGFRTTTTTTAFDCVQVLNSYNAISHNDRNGQNFYEYYVAGGAGRQLVATRERVPPPPPPRSLYNSPNAERVTCVRLSNARSLEVLQRTVRPKKVDFHRSKSFTEKTPNAATATATATAATTSNHHRQQDKVREQPIRQRVSSATPNRNKRAATTAEIGYISTQHNRSNPYNHRPELSLVFSPMKTSFDKTRTPEHPTESTFLKCRGQFLPYHTPRSVTFSSAPIGVPGHRCYDQGPVPRHRWLDGCRESPQGNFRCYACPMQRADGGHGRGSCRYYSSRPARFPKMGQSCLVGEFQRSGNNPSANRSSSSSSSGRNKTELVEC